MEVLGKKENTNSNLKKGQNNNMLMLIIGIVIGVVLGICVAKACLNNDDENSFVNYTEKKVEQQKQDENISEKIVNEDSLIVETPIVNLQYPKKWENQISVEQIVEDTHTVTFLGTVEGKEAVHMFDVVFGGTEGIFLGTMNGIGVHLVYTDINFDENWSEEEKNTIYAMQEDVNYMIGMLENESGFVPAS